MCMSSQNRKQLSSPCCFAARHQDWQIWVAAFCMPLSRIKRFPQGPYMLNGWSCHFGDIGCQICMCHTLNTSPTWKTNCVYDYMGTLSALLVFCEGTPSVTGEFHSQRASNEENWWIVRCKPEQVANLLVTWDAMTIMAWTNNNSGMVLLIYIHAFCYQSLSETTVTYQKAVDKNIGSHIAHTIVSWPGPKQWLRIHISHLRIRWSTNSLKSIKRESKQETHIPIYYIIYYWQNLRILRHIVDRICLHIISSMLSIRVHNGKV